MRDVTSDPLRDDYLESALRFINSFVNTPPELSHRIHLRNDFLALSLSDLLGSFKGMAPEVENQVNIFNDMMEEDNKELDDEFTDFDIRYHIQ